MIAVNVLLFAMLLAYVPWINYVKGCIDSSYSTASSSKDRWHRLSRLGLMYVASVAPFCVVVVALFAEVSWWHLIPAPFALTSRAFFRLGVWHTNEEKYYLWYHSHNYNFWMAMRGKTPKLGEL